MKITSGSIWDETNGKRLLLVAMCLAFVIHGVIIHFTLSKTYDAHVHMFFADHYSRFWFEPWDYRWYTGFLTISYPPLVHQLVALISKIFPLKLAFGIYGIFIFEVVVIGVYRFSKIFFDKTTAGVAAIIAVVMSSLIETLHVFGQVPTLTGIGFLLNALPFIYHFIRTRKLVYLGLSLAFIAVVISSHHVTAIFGMVFFIAPTIFMALVDRMPEDRRSGHFFQFVRNVIIEAFRNYRQIISFGILMIILAVGLIFPYWYWSSTDPITQVSIPHGSRDNFFEKFSSGLVFYIIPLAMVIALLPAMTFDLVRKRRFLAWTISIFLCLLLGSGNTTPLPKMMLGENAFNILTLDRFGFWASIIALPFMGKFIKSFLNGSVQSFWKTRYSERTHFILSSLTGFSYLLFIAFIFHLGSFRPLQPKEVDIQPIQNFLNRDEHMRWRYLTLGFGDQMAWLSANTMAATVDGNYHSARRLPELTSRPVERLENAKFNGQEGLASLKDFLTKAEKYQLKYVFSNDRYYDPLLYYTGWNRTIRLENGIMVWEKGNISTIKPVDPTQLDSRLKYMWGIFPISSLVIAVLFSIFYLKKVKNNELADFVSDQELHYPVWITYASSVIPLIFFSCFLGHQIHEYLFIEKQSDPTTTVQHFYNELDFQRFENAFDFFVPTPTYTLDQYLLEKSVNDGGILPSYAKLEEVDIIQLSRSTNRAQLDVKTTWNTSLGFRHKNELIDLVRKDGRWYIIPQRFTPEIPEEQVRSYTYTLFKKQGKRVISSFPTVKDDRVKKPFAAFKQVNLIRYLDRTFLTGEILNADAFPINMAIKATVIYRDGQTDDFYPATALHYNLGPKASSFFQIDLNLDDMEMITEILLSVDTDVSERGYIHGATLGYSTTPLENDQVRIKTRFYNELTLDINIPGILIAEKDNDGRIMQVQKALHPASLRSGLHLEFDRDIQLIHKRAQRITNLPIQLTINGQKREVLSLERDDLASNKSGIAILSHCFISQEIFLQ